MLSADQTPSCPECESGPPVANLGRRDFIRVVSASAAAVAVGGLTPLQKARAARAEKQAQAEAMVFELYKSMDGDQKKKLVMPWDMKHGNQPLPGRLMTANAPVGKSVIGVEYNKKQAELLSKIFHSICNGEEGYKRLSRNDHFDTTGAFENAGCLIYGEPVEGKKFSMVFVSHHLTVRCDGNSEEATAFGGPLYYGHSPSGYANNNVFNYQTKAVDAIFETLTEPQRKTMLIENREWKDEHGTIKPPAKKAERPGISFADMTKEQKELTEKAMKELISPYRKEDGDEVMEIIKENGGMNYLSLAFYKDSEAKKGKAEWSYWRLEGPGFVWSFRTLPHIHTFVYIKGNLA